MKERVNYLRKHILIGNNEKKSEVNSDYDLMLLKLVRFQHSHDYFQFRSPKLDWELYVVFC